MRHADLVRLAALVTDDTIVEGGALDLIRSLRPTDPMGELVSWAWVVDHRRSHTVLVDHIRGTWLPPGGRARPGEGALDAARRELAEETGLEAELVRPHPVLVDAVASTDPQGRNVTTFGVAYLFTAQVDAALVAEPGQPAQWWPLDAPPARAADHHWRRLRRAAAPG